MKKLSLLLMFAALGIFALGCEPPKAVVPVESDNTSTDGGEESPAVPAAEVKPEEKPANDTPADVKPEEKPADEPAAETKPEEQSEPKPEEKPAEPKSEEKPADEPK